MRIEAHKEPPPPASGLSSASPSAISPLMADTASSEAIVGLTRTPALAGATSSVVSNAAALAG